MGGEINSFFLLSIYLLVGNLKFTSTLHKDIHGATNLGINVPFPVYSAYKLEKEDESVEIHHTTLKFNIDFL